MKRQKEEMKRKKETKVKKSRPIKKSRRSVSYSSPSESSCGSEEWTPSIYTEDDVHFSETISDIDEDRDVAQQETEESLHEDEPISGRGKELSNEPEQKEESQKSDEPISLPGGTIGEMSCVEEEVGPITEGDMVVAVLPIKKRETECVCLVVTIECEDAAVVTPLHPCNRLRTVFRPSNVGNRLLPVSNVKYKLPEPKSYGENSGKFVFPISIPVPL